MKASPTYRMKAHYLPIDKLEVGKPYVFAPNGQQYFVVLSKTDSSIIVEYPKRKDNYRIQTHDFDFYKQALFKEKKLKQTA
jgi:hypothetical protein